jgi:hypothetical protein
MPMSLQMLLTGCLWSLLIPLLIRAIQRQELKDPRTQSTWIQLLLAGMVFTFQGETAEQHVNRLFGGFPISLYAKYYGMLLWFFLYYRMVRSIFMSSRTSHFWSGFFIGLSLLGALSIPLMMMTDNRILLRDLITGMRDTGLVIPTIVLFVPFTWRLWKQEKIQGMRTKQFALLMCYSSYVFIALGNIANAIFSAASIELSPIISALSAPFLLICCIAFLLLFIPFRWLSISFFPSRLLMYLRLKRLETYVVDAVSNPHFIDKRYRLYLRPDLLELAIYRAVINILDHYLRLKEPSLLALRDQIEAVVQNNPSYAELVEGLLEVKP